MTFASFIEWHHGKTHNLIWYFNLRILTVVRVRCLIWHRCINVFPLWHIFSFVFCVFYQSTSSVFLTWAELQWFWGAWLTPTDWWAGTLNSADWVITRKCSKLALIGPRLPKVPFGKVIFWESCVLAGQSFSKKWITVVKLWSGWIGEGWFRHLIISD